MSHLVILGIVILLVVPPDKLPEIMRNIGRLVSDFRRQTRGIFSDVTDEFRDMKSLTPEDMRRKLEELPNTSNNTGTTISAANPDKKNESV